MKKVLVFGTFDGIHPGHINFLRQAKKQGDFLTVAVARDSAVREFKGRNPKFSLRQRLDFLKNLSNVDHVIAGDKTQGSYEILRSQNCNTICLGYDQRELAENLISWLRENNFTIKIKMLKPYKATKYHTSIINAD